MKEAKKEYIFIWLHLYKILESAKIYSDRKQISGWEGPERGITMGQSEHLGDDSYIYYLDCGDGFIDV